MKNKYTVEGMTCSACSAAVHRSVKKLQGVKDVNVNLLTKSMTVELEDDIDSIDIDENVIKAVNNAGYKASVYSEEKTETKTEDKGKNLVSDELKEMKRRVILSLSFLVPLMYVSMGTMVNLPMPGFLLGPENAISFALVQFLLTLPIVYVNRKYFSVGFKTLFRLSPNMDTLIAIGSGAALVYGIFAIFRIGYGLGHGDMDTVIQYSHDLYFESAGMILALITLGKFLETRSKGKTSDAIAKLLNLAPKTATVLREGKETVIPVEEVQIGDIVLVKPGASIPVDGVIVEGRTAIDQSALTGESIPVEKNVGDKVNAATVNKSGFIKFKAEKVGNDTTLAQIVKLVEEAGSSKAPISKLADKISGVFVPVVIAIAIIASIIWYFQGYGFEFSMTIGIAVLVISCPCALGLATPVAVMVATGQGATNGVLIKSAESLEIIHSIDTIVLDKTGTITEGKPKVTDILSFGLEEKELLKIAASIEKPSEHPLAEAILQKAMEEGIEVSEASYFTAVPGRGIVATIGDDEYVAGNIEMMKDHSIDLSKVVDSDSLAKEGKTPLYFAKGNTLIGVIAVADTIKESSVSAIASLKKMGIEVIMLTGDNETTAKAIASKLDIDQVVADVMPADKESVIRNLQEDGKKVAMVGDGINDAPALVRADVGIAIGAGTDIAIESADIVLMKSDLNDAVFAVKLGKATIKNIKQNLFWAFFYNTLGIPLAAGLFYPAFGLKLSPMVGALAMSLSSVFVVSNALRLRFFNADRKS